MSDDAIHQLAASLHYRFLPDTFETTRAQAAVRIAPYDHVGGDYCTIFAPDDGRLVACMCDAVGHGYPAALVAARINTFVLTHVGKTRHPCELLAALNEFLCGHGLKTNILTTFFAVYLDFDTMELEFSGAAHPPALHYRSEDALIRHLDRRIVSRDVAPSR